MMRLATIFITVWAFLAIPVLCMAGELLHACQCGESASCAHEIDCADDPCSVIAIRTDSSIGSNDLASLTAAEIPRFHGVALDQPLDDQSHSTWLLLREKILPLPTRELPLRI